MRPLIRLQDSEGRGPWRPGFSKRWVSNESAFMGPPVYEDFPDFESLVQKAHRQGKYIGCAVRSDKISIWFTDSELKKLRSMGFSFVDCSKCDVLAESKYQAIVASNWPFKFSPAAILPEAA